MHTEKKFSYTAASYVTSVPSTFKLKLRCNWWVLTVEVLETTLPYKARLTKTIKSNFLVVGTSSQVHLWLSKFVDTRLQAFSAVHWEGCKHFRITRINQAERERERKKTCQGKPYMSHAFFTIWRNCFLSKWKKHPHNAYIIIFQILQYFWTVLDNWNYVWHYYFGEFFSTRTNFKLICIFQNL